MPAIFIRLGGVGELSRGLAVDGLDPEILVDVAGRSRPDERDDVAVG